MLLPGALSPPPPSRLLVPPLAAELQNPPIKQVLWVKLCTPEIAALGPARRCLTAG